MSVMICSEKTIIALAQRVPGKLINRQRVVDQLLAENLRSYLIRYPNMAFDTVAGVELKATDEILYRYEPCEQFASLTAIEILKLCDHFDYQCCDAPDYFTTEAARVIESVRRAALNHILVQQDFAENKGVTTFPDEVRLILTGDPGEKREAAIENLAGYEDASWGIWN